MQDTDKTSTHNILKTIFIGNKTKIFSLHFDKLAQIIKLLFARLLGINPKIYIHNNNDSVKKLKLS